MADPSDLIHVSKVADDSDFAVPGGKGPSEATLYRWFNEEVLMRRVILGKTYVSRSALKRWLFEGIAEQPPASGPTAQV